MVAGASQPWAGCFNPFGIARLRTCAGKKSFSLNWKRASSLRKRGLFYKKKTVGEGERAARVVKTKRMKFNQILGTILTLALAPLAHGQTLEVLHSFQGFEAGGMPRAGLVIGPDESFYGTTYGEPLDNGGFGTVYKIKSGIFTTLVSFNETNGASPRGDLVFGADGFLYGTTEYGGNFHAGTVFEISTNGELTTLHSFTDPTNSLDGNYPSAGLLSVGDSFYGTTRQGGAHNAGTVFRITAQGQVTTLLSFDPPAGANPRGELLLGRDGNLYGTTSFGGTKNFGTVFKMKTNGLLIFVTSFDNTNGATPFGALIQASSGTFYGTTQAGGTNNSGTIFQITETGLLNSLFSFNGSNGGFPKKALLELSDGSLCGTAFSGGLNNIGTIFKLTTNGLLTTLFSFDNTHGSYPSTRVVQGKDGNLYGTAIFGGLFDDGIVFRLVFPSLTSRLNGSQLLLSWPTNQVGFTLQTAADLNSSTNWIDSTNAPVVLGAQFMLTNSISGNAQFYRLHKP
jgi:uncharacterized repeat protein (TIGR03803 family)